MIYENDVKRLNEKIIQIALTLLYRDNETYSLFDYVYDEACKSLIGILDTFDETNQILKNLTLSDLENKEYVTIHLFYGLIWISLTQKAITEFQNQTRKEPEWSPSENKPKLQLLKSLPRLEQLKNK